MSISSPIRWLGGKSRLAPWIISQFPEHRVYVEPFGGGASVLLTKPPCPKEVYCDIDIRLVRLFREIRDNHKELVARLLTAPYSRQLRNRCLDKKDPFSFFIASQQSFGGMVDKTAWGMVSNHSADGMASTVKHYIKVIEAIPRFSRRLQSVKILRGDWARCLKYDSSQTLFYLDPPYVPGTRRDGDYANEMTLKDHARMIDGVKRLKGKVILSGYPNDLYKNLENSGWLKLDKQTTCAVAARTTATGLKGTGKVADKQKRVEALWLNGAARKKW